MATVQIAGEQRILLPGVSWQAYETLLREFDGRPIRLTYDQGSLEIMTLSFGHERYKKLLGRLIEGLADELGIDFTSGGSVTIRQEEAKRGLEADECYWIQNEALIRGKMELDLRVDPPPDLAIEIDLTRSSLDRMAIYAGLGVREVWRFDGETLRVYRLRASKKYEECEHSPTFPDLPLGEVLRTLGMIEGQSEARLVRSFRAWVREHVLPATRASKRVAPAEKPRRRPKK